MTCGDDLKFVHTGIIGQLFVDYVPIMFPSNCDPFFDINGNKVGDQPTAKSEAKTTLNL